MFSIRAASRAQRVLVQASAKRAFHQSPAALALSKFQMPAMSPTMTEGGISSWKLKEGDTFAAGDIILEIETDKATMDVEAQDDGILAKILVADGTKGVKVGTLIAVVGEEGDDVSGADAIAKEGGDAASEAPAQAQADSSDASAQKSEEVPQETAKSGSSEITPALATPADETKYGSGSGGKDAQKSPKEAGGADKPKFFSTPSARKLALEKGVPLGQVKGSGPEGRIVKADVEAYKGTSSSSSSAAAKTPTSATSATPNKAAPVAPAEYEDIPASSMRKTIGKRLLDSKTQVPHYYVTVEVNMDRVMKLREMFNKASEGKSKLSVNDFIVKASALALAEVPEANSAWLGETIRQYKKADICIAVATPTGLITPIVKDAGGKGLASISSEVKALAGKARDGKLKPEEYQGGSFTISNLGMFGVQEFTAIINPPQSCILAIGATVDRLLPDASSEKGFKVAQMMNATLSADHRTVDGAVGARWLKAFKGYMENPLTFML